ncbi:hypothetical protein QN277_013788 [Acacia crassicarpa]|uniref:Proteasome assembly chaperone 3 n=1 Tax=Acacia crassicarpa TaxID=499986 RepID=A0AAE1N406_9FABA|nr:hypothetical protein QN277_013784 [Acacia crassicarpa]KAK4282406.1 hypothetical protein QN277_013788 [Acacia crassicarpa]
MSLGDTFLPSFPVPHKHLSLPIKGNKTEILISSYEDRFLVIATQIGTMGTILHARLYLIFSDCHDAANVTGMCTSANGTHEFLWLL